MGIRTWDDGRGKDKGEWMGARIGEGGWDEEEGWGLEGEKGWEVGTKARRERGNDKGRGEGGEVGR